jgi:RNase P subunit RPR2
MSEPAPAKWLALVSASRWRLRPQRTFARELRCGVCRQIFQPGASGAPTFVEEGGSILLRTCPRCAPLFKITSTPIDES